VALAPGTYRKPPVLVWSKTVGRLSARRFVTLERISPIKARIVFTEVRVQSLRQVSLSTADLHPFCDQVRLA
jgi:hypothetical protein